jgi:hypothetical protein
MALISIRFMRFSFVFLGPGMAQPKRIRREGVFKDSQAVLCVRVIHPFELKSIQFGFPVLQAKTFVTASSGCDCNVFVELGFLCSPSS